MFVRTFTLLILLSFFSLLTGNAQPGKPDPSFGGKGQVKESFIPLNISYESIFRVFTGENGSYIALIQDFNNRTNLLARFLPDGSLDRSYGDNGYAYTNLSITAAVQQNDKKILVAGETYDNSVPGNYVFHFNRYNTDGSLDSTFNGDGKQTNDFVIISMAVQNNGKVIVGGTTNLRRYNADGSPDTGLGENGLLTFNFGDNNLAFSIGVQNDGKVIVAGTKVIVVPCDRVNDPKCQPDEFLESVLVRYNTDGTPDNNFGKNGQVTSNFHFGDYEAHSAPEYIASSNILAVQSDGKIVVTGTVGNGSNLDVGLERYTSEGAPDTSFNTGGMHPADFGGNEYPSSLTFQNDGKIIVTAWTGQDYAYASADFDIARYNTDGTLDKAFNGNGKLIIDFGVNDFANTAVVLSNGKIIVAGATAGTKNWDFAMVSIKADGSPDNSFSNNGKETGYIPVGAGDLTSLAVQSDRKKVVAGTVRDTLDRNNFFVARYNADGSVDKTFGDDGKQITDFGFSDSYVNSIAIQADGRIVAAGLVFVNGIQYFAIARYNIDGSPDSTFNGNGRAITTFANKYSASDISSVLLQSDGKIVVGGTLDDFAFNFHPGVARYNSNGSLDSTFGNSGLQIADFGFSSSEIRAIALQKDGKIVAAGRAFVNGTGNFAIIRYNSNGSVDKTFGNNGVQLTEFAGNNDPALSIAIQSDQKIIAGGGSGLARYNSNGTADTSFDGDGKLILPFTCFSLSTQDDGKIVASGAVFNSNFIGDIAISRLNNNGSFDSSFDLDGRLIADLGGDERASASAIADNKLYVAGTGIIAAFKLDGIGNKAPVVALAAPADNARYVTPAAVTLEAIASDADGTITSVQFYNGSTLLATDSTSPYSYTLNNLAPGNYSLVAKATDNSGLTNNSATVNVSVVAAPNKGPAVSLSNPVNNATFISPAAITLNATASDADGTVKYVKFYNGSTLLATDSLAPYSYAVSNAATGTYKFYAEATDNNGLKNSSSSVTAFVVNGTTKQAPTVSITSPKNNASYPAVATVVLHAAASDQDGTITAVQFYSGSTLLATDNTAPYSYSISHPPPGSYNFVAKAIDNNGLITNSSTVNVTVGVAGNKAPAIDLSAPSNNAIYQAGSAITLNATANDADGTIKNVKFYSGATLLATDNTSPYSYTINNAVPGSYKFFAKATDNTGLTNSSSSVSVFVVTGASGKAPVISLVNPKNNAIHYAPGTIFLHADANDEDGAIDSVKFYMDSTLLATVSIAPYNYTLTGLPAGVYSFTAKAIDNSGLESNTASATVPVLAPPNKAPVISLTNPENNAIYTAPAGIALHATASDADGTIASVKFYNGATLLKTVSTPPYTYTLNTAAAGTYKFYAKATDNKGLSSSSATVYVTVNAGSNNGLAAGKKPATNGSRFSAVNISKSLNGVLHIKLAPNPVRNVLNITTSGLATDKKRIISIVSTSGTVFKTIQASGLAQTIKLDVSSLLPGMYIIKMISGDKVMYRQFIKI